VAFFAALLNLTQGLAVKKHARDQPQPAAVTAAPIVIGHAGANGEASEADIDAANIFRLPALVNALQAYAKDHGGMLPPMATPKEFAAAVSPKYASNPDIFASPRHNLPYVPNPALSGKALASITNPGSMVAFYEPLPGAGSASKPRAVVFLSGIPSAVDAATWTRLQQQMAKP